MKKVIILILLLLGVYTSFVQHADASDKDSLTDLLSRINAEPETKRRMILAHENADRFLRNFFGDSIFETNIKWDLQYSSVDVKHNYTLTDYLDTIDFLPDAYHMNYKIYQQGIYVDFFYLQADSLCVVDVPPTHFEFDELMGYKKLLNGSFKVTYAEALRIGKKHRIDGDNAYAKLGNNRDEIYDSAYKGQKVVSYFWEVSIQYCDHCRLIHIDPYTGKIKKGDNIKIYQY